MVHSLSSLLSSINAIYTLHCYASVRCPWHQLLSSPTAHFFVKIPVCLGFFIQPQNIIFYEGWHQGSHFMLFNAYQCVFSTNILKSRHFLWLTELDKKTSACILNTFVLRAKLRARFFWLVLHSIVHCYFVCSVLSTVFVLSDLMTRWWLQ